MDKGTKLTHNSFTICLLSPWPKELVFEDGTVISSGIPVDQADGLLCYWAPFEDELFRFPGPGLWYNCEPKWCFDQIRDGEFARIAERLPSNVLVNHRNPDPAYRVPHITHWGPLKISSTNAKRIERGIAIVSNNGAGASWIHEDLKLRNRLATARGVDLFGRLESWRNYSRTAWIGSRPPKNYRGEIDHDDGKWHGDRKRALQARYSISIALENICEQNYFTEKFVEAVLAGCIPVYCADNLVAETFLKEAVWVDPKNFDFSTRRVMKAALKLDREEVAGQNALWLKENKFLAQSQGERVLERLAAILRRQ